MLAKLKWYHKSIKLFQIFYFVNELFLHSLDEYSSDMKKNKFLVYLVWLGDMLFVNYFKYTVTWHLAVSLA